MAGASAGAHDEQRVEPFWRRVGVRRLLVLVAAAGVCAIIEVIWHPGDEVGLLGIGLGLALANVLWSARILRADIDALHLLAVALGLVAIAWGARAGYVGRGAASPGLLVGLVGLLVLGLTQGAAPGFYAWLTSLWAPVVLLPLIGLALLARGALPARTV